MAGRKAAPGSSAKPNGPPKHKRKRDFDGAHATSSPNPTKKHKKHENMSAAPTHDGDSSKKRRRVKDMLQGDDSEKTTAKESAVSRDRGKASAENHFAEGRKKSKKSKRKSSGQNIETADGPANVNADGIDVDGAEHQNSKRNKHAGILSKFERTKAVSKAKSKSKPESASETITAEPVIAEGLEPLPQPENPLEPEETPTYSSLPAWLRNPLRTSANERSQFSELGIKEDIVRILEKFNYKEAFAVQSTVIPLLLLGTKHHPGDLCISAATGSGKTLSYVLPLVTALNLRPVPRLRGLIVVPTRELVRQAREACELCASGSRLRIGSAVGNVAIKDEQRLLMRIDQVYNPVVVRQRQREGLRGNDWMDFSLQDYISAAVDSHDALPDHIQRPEPNVDILICTPGRLVDHLRYTKGFTLKYLEWLVIDEADRLLNESFQEWVDVVTGSLNARQDPSTLGSGGQFLADLGLPIESKAPRKVVLSATMTRDISKLNSLRLANPKMVIIGSDPDGSPSAHPEAQFTLPPTLREYMVAVGDGSQKPLYLLCLLLSQIKVSVDSATDPQEHEIPSSDDDTSDDGTSSDESFEASSSLGSDSDSDSKSSDESSESEDSAAESVELVPNAGPQRTTVLIFTKSSESASRLSRLISILHPPLARCVGTIIKSNKSSASRKTLTAYRRGQLSVIVATDRASRGLDLPLLTDVVNYDVPTSVTTYVHRVGRTARADHEGSAWTLVAHREGRWFANEIAKAGDGHITRALGIDRVPVKLEAMGSLVSKYPAALDELEQEVRLGSKANASFKR